MVNAEAENCWEYWDCQPEKRDKCRAYLSNAGKKCFYLSTDFKPCVEGNFESCAECPWLNKVLAM